jgi:methyl-accepting chemotaxis protein
MNNFRIGARLTLAFGIVFAITLIVVVMGIYEIGSVNRKSQYVSQNITQAMLQSKAWLNLESENWIRTQDLMKTADDGYRNELNDLVLLTSAQITAIEQKLRKQSDNQSLNKLIDQSIATRQTFVLQRKAQIEIRMHDEELTENQFNELKNLREAYRGNVESVANYAEDLLSQVQSQNMQEAEQRQMILGGSALLCILIGLWMSWYATKSIVSPLKEAVGVAKRVAEGDLTAIFKSDAKDEVGDLFRVLSEMTQGLKNVVGEVRTSTKLIASTSRQIASENVELSQRTEQQATALEETASTMEELTSTVKGNAVNAQNANKLAKEASDIAAHGGVAMKQVLDTMNRISASSSKIVDIISVIDGIAFQTNILALNAAVEAARAGEHGRGFAVVATEVRNLAHRSALSAKEIKVLISQSVDEVDRGATYADDAGKTINDVVAAVNRMAVMMSEVTLSSQEQASGIEQLNIAIAQIDHGTQQNAAMVEQGTAATELLSQQANSLEQAVSALHVGQDEVSTSVSGSAVRKSTGSGLKAAKKQEEKNSFGTSEPVLQNNDDDWTKF